MRYSLQRKKEKKTSFKAACPNSLCSVRPDCPGPSRRRSAEGREGGIPPPPPPVPRRSRLPPACNTNNNPSPSKPPTKKVLFVCCENNRAALCLFEVTQTSPLSGLVIPLFLYFTTCLLFNSSPHQGGLKKKITSVGDESRQLFVRLYSDFLAVCVKVF